MSWMRQLYDTYEANVGRTMTATDAKPLLPVSHALQQAHVEIALNPNGDFLRAMVIQPEYTIIPVTEDSSNRTANNAPHGLSDKVQYVAGDYEKFGGLKRSYFSSYLKQLQEWCLHSSHSTPRTVLTYVQKRSLVADLVGAGVFHVDPANVLLTGWPKGSRAPDIFQILMKKEGIQDQGDALVRWRVETPGDPLSASWEDSSLAQSWIDFVTSGTSRTGYCQISGSKRILARKHPAKLRDGKDGAKLISSNDVLGYTFRGRFLDADQAVAIGSDVTQKAHSALRWLIGRRQAHRNGSQAIVTWAVSGKGVPDPLASSDSLFADPDSASATVVPYSHDGDVGQAFSRRLAKLIAGYNANLGPADDIITMGLESATPGRMAITFYRELKGSEFLERINRWHEAFAWPQCYSRDHAFVGVPSLKEITQAAFGDRADEKILRSTLERLLPCIIDGRPIPNDLVDTVVRRCQRREGVGWGKTVGIACSMFRGSHKERNYSMALEPDRKTRDYLYGRLFALAEHLEQRALYVADENRDTTAARLMQRFCDRPCSTWLSIEKGLQPYRSRLQSKCPGFLYWICVLIDEVHTLFDHKDFVSDDPLTGEWLLGYHCQRRELKASPERNDASSNETQTVEGD